MEPAASYTPPVLGLAFASLFLFFFFNDTATTEIYTLSLHDALPILGLGPAVRGRRHGGENGQRRCKSCHIRHPGGARPQQSRTGNHGRGDRWTLAGRAQDRKSVV